MPPIRMAMAEQVSLNVLHDFKPGGEDSSEWSSRNDGAAAHWSVSIDPSTGSHDKLFVSGNRVVWFNGLDPSSKAVKISYTMETNILQAFWCQFEIARNEKEDGGYKDVKNEEDAKTVRGVCVREQESITLFLQTGAVHYVSLPFQVRHVWPLTGGLLIERVLPTEGGYDGLPTLFTLLHPSDDLCPVTCRRPAAASVSVTVLGFFSDPQQRVLSVCADGKGDPLVVSRNMSSGQHFIWSIQKATQNDIPAHLATPLKPGSGLMTPQQPLSTSAPSYYGNKQMTTPTSLMNTPVEMLLSATRPTNGQDPQQLPLLTQLHKRGALGLSTGKQEGGSGVKVYGTGRSPFISRLHAPHEGSTQITRKRSKSLSPLVLARISPFSQAVNSRSWSTFYSEEFSFGKNFEPLLPQVCLRLLWRESDNGLSSDNAEVASIQKTSDFTGNKFVVLTLPSQHKLWLLRFTDDIGEPLSFGAVTTLVATQVVPIEAHPMMVVLEPSTGLSLYSGYYKVATIDTLPLYNYSTKTTLNGDTVAMDTNNLTTPSIFPEVRVSEIRDPLGVGFTVRLNSGLMFRSSITKLYRHRTVNLCLQAIKELLSPEVTQHLLANYYISSHCVPSSELMEHFEQWLLASLSLPPTQMEGNPHHVGVGSEGQFRVEPTANVVGGASKSPWQHVQDMVQNDNMMVAVPALQMFVTNTRSVGVVNKRLATPTLPVFCVQSHIQTVLLALHLVYEELKLNTLLYDSLHQLARLLIHISSCLGWKAYMDHYWRDFPHLMSESTSVEEEAMDDSSTSHTLSPPSPPHLLHWLAQSLRRKPVQPFLVIPSVCVRTASIIKLYSLYCCGEGKPLDINTVMKVIGKGDHSQEQNKFKKLQESSPLPWARVVLCLSEGLDPSDLETLPVGVALPLWDSIIKCQEDPPSTWPQAAYDIIGRRDVVESLRAKSILSHLNMEDPEDCKDGMNTNQEILRLRFPKDLRIKEVRRLLQSSSPVRIALTQKPEVSDHEFLEQQETHLLSLCQRTMALPVGRGIFTLSSSQPLPTAPPAIPSLNLSGRVPPKNSAVGLEHVDKPADMSTWAEFHNGVAAGLKIAPGISQLDRTWIVYNRPSDENLSNEYAGFLMALGLNGHLTSVPDYELYNLLKEKHELIVIGLLLGITAARAGSVNLPLISLLSIYFPPLLPHGAADMEIPPPIQTAAMMGLGLLYLGSANRHMTEVMLREIGHTQGPELEFAEDRESYSLTAGISLGMITLGLGSSPLGLSDLHLVDQLCVFMNGGPKSEVSLPRTAGEGHLVLEVDQVNTHVTAPGAILALGLMYLKTNDSAVAATLDAPSTQYDLDCIRPDFLLLRALSRCLIMWDTVEPSMEWIKDNHLPEIVLQYAFQGAKAKPTVANIDYQTLSQAYVNIVAGCCMGMGLCYAGTGDGRARECLLQCVREFLSKLESSGAEQAGKPCLERCVVVVVLALAVVMSGSGDLDVLRIVRGLRLSHPEMCYGNHMAVHMALGFLFIGGGRYSLNRSNTSIASLLCSLYPMFPNTSSDNRYHLQAFRHLYVLAAEPRILVTQDIKTGKTCSVEVSVSFDDSEIRTLTPCIVPEWSSIEKISVCSDCYWPMTFDLTSPHQTRLRHNLSKSGCIFVKQRTSHSQHAMKSLPGCWYGIGKVRGVVDVPCSGLSGDPTVKMLCQQLALPHMQKEASRVQSSTVGIVQRSSWTKFLVSALLECVQEEKLQVLTSFLQLEHNASRSSLLSDIFTAHTLWQVKLVAAMCCYSNDTSRHGSKGKPVIGREYADGLLMRFKNCLDQSVIDTIGSSGRLDDILQQYLFSNDGITMATSLSWEEASLLAWSLVLNDIPSPTHIQITRQSVIPDLYTKLNSLQVPMTAIVRLLKLISVISP